jgi:hypothetical protein
MKKSTNEEKETSRKGLAVTQLRYLLRYFPMYRTVSSLRYFPMYCLLNNLDNSQLKLPLKSKDAGDIPHFQRTVKLENNNEIRIKASARILLPN